MLKGKFYIFFFQAEDGIRDSPVTGVQTCALPILLPYFRKSENDLTFGSDDFHGNEGPIPVRRYAEEIGRASCRERV